MKTLQNNFTTPEQSKRLLELGVPADSADCYFNEWQHENIRGADDLNDGFFLRHPECFPCWSVGRLIEIYLTCANDYVCDGCCAEIPSLHFIQHDRDKFVSTLIELMSEDEMDFSKLED